MIIGLFTDLSGFGGIQRIGCHVAVVLDRIAGNSGSESRVLALNDNAGFHTVMVDNSSVAFRGFGHQRFRFAIGALSALIKSRVAYIGHPNLAPLGLMARLLRPRFRYVVATHGVEVWQRLPLIQRLSLRFASCVTAPSSYTAQMVKLLQGVDSLKLIMLPWAVEPGILARSKHGTESLKLPKGKLLLTVGRMDRSEQMKGIDTVIRALPEILEQVPDTNYVVIGNGDDRPRLELLARELGVDKHVMFAGTAINGDELLNYYDACDLFVMPSQQEGFGLVFAEAMARAKPVIGARHGGTLDVVVEGSTGFLVDYGDSGDLAKRIILLLQSPPLRNEMGAAGRRRVEENFTFDILEKRLAVILNQIVMRQPLKNLAVIDAESN
jgi:phosphatidyl-myo-inositol dimannoside synthase